MFRIRYINVLLLILFTALIVISGTAAPNLTAFSENIDIKPNKDVIEYANYYGIDLETAVSLKIE